MAMWPPDGIFRVLPPPYGNSFGVAIIGQSHPLSTFAEPPDSSSVPNAVPIVGYVAGITASGNTTIIAAVAGRAITLAGYAIMASVNASKAAGALAQLTLTDGAGGTVVGGAHAFFPGAAVTTGVGVDFLAGPITYPPGNGPKLTTGNALVYNGGGGGVLATGAISVHAWGWQI